MESGNFGEHGFCPLTYNLCVGAENCAPARAYAQRENEYRNPESDVMCKPLCPITQATEFVGTLVSMVSILAAGNTEDAPKSDEDMTQPERRESILAEMNLDGS